MKMTNTKRCQKYREMQKPLVEKDEPTEKSTNQDFPPTPPGHFITQKNCRWFLQSYSTCKVWRSWIGLLNILLFLVKTLTFCWYLHLDYVKWIQ